jgi:hypothetical protein
MKRCEQDFVCSDALTYTAVAVDVGVGRAGEGEGEGEGRRDQARVAGVGVEGLQDHLQPE